jgi:DNA-binding MarR family transcriptional regulator
MESVTVDPTALDEAVLSAARAVMRASLRAADQLGEVSVIQLRALTVLRAAPDANLAQLAEGMGVTVSTTSRLVDRLVTADLVERRPAPHTRREIALRLTARGEQTVDRYDGLRLADLRRRVEQLPEAEQAAAVIGLRALGAAGGPA